MYSLKSMEYVYEIPNNLKPEVCACIIENFKGDTNKRPGKTNNENPEAEIIKRSMDLPLELGDSWDNIIELLRIKLKTGLEEYMSHVKSLHETDEYWFDHVNEFLIHTGFQIQHSTEGQYYKWHQDGFFKQCRVITAIWYLNTLNEDQGGTTDFTINKKLHRVRPEVGKLLLFPATWTYPHRGDIVKKGDKYIITAFVSNFEL